MNKIKLVKEVVQTAPKAVKNAAVSIKSEAAVLEADTVCFSKEAMQTIKNVKDSAQKTAEKLENYLGEANFSTILNKEFATQIAPQFSTTARSQGIADIIKQAEAKGMSFNSDDFINLMDKLSKQEFVLPENVIKKLTTGESYQLFAHDYLNKRMYSNFVSLMKKTPQKEGESFSQYFSRIAKLREKRVKQLEKFRIDNIKSKLKYAPDEPEKLIELSDFERKKLIDYLNKEIKRNNAIQEKQMKLIDYDTPLEKLKEPFKHLYLHGMSSYNEIPHLTNATNALFQRMDRYCSKRPPKTVSGGGVDIAPKDYKTPFENEPVYRWLQFKNPNKFVNEMPKAGELYSYEAAQSCSTHKTYAEFTISDYFPEFNVKFILHPKSQTSKAYNLGMNQEVIYAPNTKFKIIDKELIEDIEKTASKSKTPSTSLCRWEVHMQEV